MKKIVGTILAASLVFGAFAADPAANFVMSEFTGSAEFGFKADFRETNAVRFGMFNNDSANLKFGFVTAGDKATTGDGVWGELGIKLGDPIDWDADSPKMVEPTISTAKIHLINGDFYAALDILTPSLVGGAYTPLMATPASIGNGDIGKEIGTVKKGGDGVQTQAGFGVNLGMDSLFDMNVKFVDNGIAQNKKFGLAFDVAVKALPDLTAKVMGTFNFDAKYTGIAAELGYALKLADPLYIQPGASFTFASEPNAADKSKNDTAMNLAAGLMFGWGGKDLEPGLDFIAVGGKTNEGVSVAVSTNMKDNGLKLAVGLYDESLFKMLGLDSFGTLKTGVEYVFDQSAQDHISAAAKYHLDLSPIYFDLHGGMKMTMSEVENVKNTMEYAVGVGLGSTEVIDNTDLYVKYELGGKADPANTGITKNEVVVGTKISF